MSDKTLPFSKKELESIIEKFPTPFHIYDEKAIVDNARRLNKAYSWNPGFKEFFAIKATPNPYIIQLMRREKFGVDCSSMAELELAEKIGMRGDEIMFTSNDTPAEDFRKAMELGAIINLDDIAHIEFLEKNAGLPELICMRYNPGVLKEGNAIIGHPEEAKYGFTRQQLFDGYKIAVEKGVKRFGIHTMVASNELEVGYFIETAHILFDLISELSDKLGIRFEFVNLGGGIGIPYKEEENIVDFEEMSKGIHTLYNNIIVAKKLDPLNIYFEMGRAITGPYGYLVSKTLHIKNTYKNYVGLDSCMVDLMRPALYGAYHHITIAGKEKMPAKKKYDVTGSLCENNDKFAIDRWLPEVEVGDIIVIHDAGAHGYSMGFNYNGKLKSAELLLKEDGNVIQIRRAETVEDYFATLDFEGIPTI